MQQKPLRRHTNADIVTKTKLVFDEHASQSGLCSVCTKEGSCEVGLKAKTGRTVFPEPFGTAQFAGEKRLPNIEDIQILPELYGNAVFFHSVKTEAKIGGFRLKLPLTIGALGSTKIANVYGKDLGEGAAKAGIVYVIGENMLATHGKKGIKERIDAFLNSYDKKYGAIIVQGNSHDIEQGVFEVGKELGAMGIEIKLGQGAKQGLGGEIKFEGKKEAEKYKKLGYLIVKNPDGSYQRHASPGSLSDNSLRETLIKYSKLDLPIWIKIGMGSGISKLINSLQKIKKEQGIKIECLTVDGFGGGTGMSPWLIMNETALPSAALFSTLKNKLDFDILLAGGYSSGIDIAKAMMLGANGVAMGRPFIIAAGTAKAQGIANFVSALKEELQMICATQRVDSVDKLIGKRENLYPLDDESASMFGLKKEIK